MEARKLMRTVVTGRNIEITDAIKEYTKEKFAKIINHFDQIQLIEVTLSVVKNPSVAEKHVAEVICKLPSGNIVSEETAESMYASIDLLVDKLNRQIKKYKDKHLNPKNKTESIRTEDYNKASDVDQETNEEE